MTIRRKNPYGPITPSVLTAFDRQLPGALPADFRSFLLEFNGADFSDCPEFDDIEGGTALAEVFGLHGGPTYLRLDEMFVQMKRHVPPGILVFAADPFGNYFGLALTGKDRESVYFLNHEEMTLSREDLPEVASSFGELLERAGGTDLESRPYATTVEAAVSERDYEALARLLSSGEAGRGHVHRAVASGDVEIVRLILEGGGDPDERGAINGTETPLFVAARQGRADITALLLERGADPNARCSAGGVPIEMAAPFPEVLRLIVRAGAKPTKPSIAEAVRRLLGR